MTEAQSQHNQTAKQYWILAASWPFKYCVTYKQLNNLNFKMFSHPRWRVVTTCFCPRSIFPARAATTAAPVFNFSLIVSEAMALVSAGFQGTQLVGQEYICRSGSLKTFYCTYGSLLSRAQSSGVNLWKRLGWPRLADLANLLTPIFPPRISATLFWGTGKKYLKIK